MSDYVVVKKQVKKKVKNAKVIPGEECFAQHRRLVMNLVGKKERIRKTK